MAECHPEEECHPGKECYPEAKCRREKECLRGEMAECPCYAQVDGKDVIVVSGCGVKEKDGRYKNGNISVFAVGDIDFENKRMNIDFVKEMDCGDCFYAPQFVNDAPRPTVIVLRSSSPASTTFSAKASG